MKNEQYTKRGLAAESHSFELVHSDALYLLFYTSWCTHTLASSNRDVMVSEPTSNTDTLPSSPPPAHTPPSTFTRCHTHIINAVELAHPAPPTPAESCDDESVGYRSAFEVEGSIGVTTLLKEKVVHVGVSKMAMPLTIGADYICSRMSSCLGGRASCHASPELACIAA